MVDFPPLYHKLPNRLGGCALTIICRLQLCRANVSGQIKEPKKFGLPRGGNSNPTSCLAGVFVCRAIYKFHKNKVLELETPIFTQFSVKQLTVPFLFNSNAFV